jgi:hypothetical protein
MQLRYSCSNKCTCAKEGTTRERPVSLVESVSKGARRTIKDDAEVLPRQLNPAQHCNKTAASRVGGNESVKPRLAQKALDLGAGGVRASAPNHLDGDSFAPRRSPSGAESRVFRKQHTSANIPEATSPDPML